MNLSPIDQEALRQVPPIGPFHLPVEIECERRDDAEPRESLLDRAFGPARHGKTCEKLRFGRRPADGLALVARCGGSVIGTVRLWPVAAGGVPVLLLGPLAVDDAVRGQGIGARLMREAIGRARVLGHRAILLVGDAPYYEAFGFTRRHTLGLRMPGPVESGRFLGLELQAGALDGASGLVRATGLLDTAAPLPYRRRRTILPKAA